MSVYENITFQQNIRKEQINSLLEMVCISDDIEKLKDGSDTIIDNEQKDGTELSLGQWQKLAFCRAMCHGGDFLIYDEPTSSVDAGISEKIQDVLLKESKDKLVILISHDEVDDTNITYKMFIRDGQLKVEKRDR